MSALTYLVADRIDSAPIPVPGERRAPFGLSAVAVPPAESVGRMHLRWSRPERIERAARLRITVAIDDRAEKRVEAFLTGSGRVLGRFDIRYGDVCQPFEIMLAAEDATAAMREGLSLRMTHGSGPLWLFGDASLTPALAPHILAGTDDAPEAALRQRIMSLDSLQQFSWKEGCVLDGLMDLEQQQRDGRARAAAEAHLRLFFDGAGGLVYEGPHSEVRDGQIYGIECTLPFAAVAQLWPEHPSLALAMDFWRQLGAGEDRPVTAEGSYTLAWPMAVLARVRGLEEFAERAVRHLALRRARLVVGNDIYLRSYPDGRRTYRNWGRGIAWYLLGLVRTLHVLGDVPGTRAMHEEFVRAAHWALQHQQPGGLWTCFIDDPATGEETSGSAGIAAALAIGVRGRLLDESAMEAARRTRKALWAHLTPDGMLGGVTQSNKVDEAFQRSGYRVIFHPGMGLMAQLLAACG